MSWVTTTLLKSFLGSGRNLTAVRGWFSVRFLAPDAVAPLAPHPHSSLPSVLSRGMTWTFERPQGRGVTTCKK